MLVRMAGRAEIASRTWKNLQKQESFEKSGFIDWRKYIT